MKSLRALRSVTLTVMTMMTAIILLPLDVGHAYAESLRVRGVRPPSETQMGQPTLRRAQNQEPEFEIEILDDQDAELFLSNHGITDEDQIDGVPIIRRTYRTGEAYIYNVHGTAKSTRGSCVARSGEASWYGPGFHGKKTANGERFNQNDRTAAHRTLPFGTLVRVTYKGRSTVVRINDAGPYVGNRVIDLSRQAAADIGLLGAGHGNVSIEVLSCG
jgi:rare lipoprotein A